MSPSCMRHFAAQMHYNGDDGSVLIFVYWIYDTGVVLARPAWTARTFILLEYVLLVIDSVWSRNLTLTRCQNTLQWRWRLCVGLRLLNVWNGCRIVAGQTARTFVFTACVLEFDTYCWCSIQYVLVIISPLRAVQTHCNDDAWCFCVDLRWFDVMLLCFPNTLKQWRWLLCVDLCWFHAWDGVSCWPWTNSVYVYLYWSVCAWINWTVSLVINAVWWGCNLNFVYTTMTMAALHWSSFVNRMKWVLYWRALDEQRVRLYCLNTCYWC